MKIIWKVQPAPVGRYRSFQKRGWPHAYYENENGEIAAYITCEDDYVPANVKVGKHAPLTVRIADHSATPWQWCRLKATFATLDEAKAAAEALLNRFPKYQPKQEVV